MRLRCMYATAVVKYNYRMKQEMMGWQWHQLDHMHLHFALDR